MSETNEVRKVDAFWAAFSGPDTLDVAQRRLATQIEAAGYAVADAVWSVHYHPSAGVFVCVATVVPTADGPAAWPGEGV